MSLVGQTRSFGDVSCFARKRTRLDDLRVHTLILVVDVRGPNAFGKGHVKGAIDIPHRQMTATRMAEYPKDKVFVVYYAGPHCNGANKAALRLARLGLPVKTMIGGVTAWIDESFTLTPS
jgi:rhodanese-related sulfurtransferase